ncbi:MAG: hypothetical protein ACJ74Y_12320 [Bryobacteraceae bacterium]
MSNRKLLGVLLTAGCLMDADTLVLRSGRSIEGTFVGGDGRSVRFDDGRSAATYNIGDVESIRFVGGGPNSTSGSASGAQSANYPPPSSGPSSTVAPWPSTAPPSNNPPPAASSATSSYPQQTANGNPSVSVPPGTQIVVRLIDPVNSDLDHLGQTYRVSLDEPVVVDGQTVIPRGADAVAFLIDSQHSGKIQGRTSLTLDLKTVTVNGRQYDVTTTGVSQASQGRGERSTKVIGGTAALGAIIGAIAGGGKGAAIGAGSGAAAGTAAQVMTSGQKVKIPSETRLTFTLQNPLNL